MSNSFKEIHPSFRLQGEHYTKEQLREVAYSLIKEGEDFEKSIGDFLIDWLNDADYLVVQTSGSTGKPKKIQLQKEYMKNSAVVTGEFFGLKPKDTALLCLPASYIAGKMMLVRSMVLGLHLDYINPTTEVSLKADSGYDFAAMVPLQVENSLSEIHKIKYLIVGGAAVSEELKVKIGLTGIPTQIYETYGMTETITHIAVKKIHPNDNIQENFKALKGVTFKQDERSCLIIEAQQVTDEPVLTNDVVNLVSEKEFNWLGRYDNVINSAGVKLFPEQIEAKLGKFLSQRFFVAGIPDQKLGHKLVLILEGEGQIVAVRDKIAKSPELDTYERPKDIYFVKTFMETTSGKIQRNKTMELLPI
ncbi:AMP-binding protein [Euzebyella saccharophila]|uniref:AMP-binding protein n=1 Tax=Euzebyella saccharophila TaxID=679664 RepID=A0ABV8JSB8_9FLAO|nr:AMP-binding protein [Euzebyella saccharophila]